MSNADDMDQDKLRILKLLEAIESGERTTQRELAKDLNISLGLVNAFMKRLAKKGYFKITNIPSNRVRYLLTPEGMREKSRLTYEYIRYSIGFYRGIREVLLALFNKLQEEGVQQVALYGCGEVAELAHLFLQNTSIRLAGVYDEKADGRRFFGHKVQNFEALADDGCDMVLLTYTEDIQSHRNGLIQAGVKPECILNLQDYAS